MDVFYYWALIVFALNLIFQAISHLCKLFEWSQLRVLLDHGIDDNGAICSDNKLEEDVYLHNINTCIKFMATGWKGFNSKIRSILKGLGDSGHDKGN